MGNHVQEGVARGWMEDTTVSNRLGGKTQQKARKDYRCTLCGEGIAKGSQYVRWSLHPSTTEIGAFVHMTIHADCYAVYEASGLYDADVPTVKEFRKVLGWVDVVTDGRVGWKPDVFEM